MKLFAFLILLLMVGLSFTAISSQSSVSISKGECFQYRELIAIYDGKGNYSGYSCNIWINGTESVTGFSSNSSVDMHYNYSCAIISTSGDYNNPYMGSGTFNFSSVSCNYINGTDNETGYNHSHVWFYVHPSLEKGNETSLLGTPMTVVSNSYNYKPGGSKNTINTIYLSGNGTCVRDDSFGHFNADYTWKGYFDHSAGFIAAYIYTQVDSNSNGDGFSCTNSLYVSHSTYGVNISEVAPVSHVTTTSPSFPYTDLFVIIAFIFVLLIIVAVVASRGKRNKLKQHSSYSPGVNMKHEHSDNEHEIKPEPDPEQKVTEQVVIKEIVKVKCQYCGALIDSTVEKCPFCGAPRT